MTDCNTILSVADAVEVDLIPFLHVEKYVNKVFKLYLLEVQGFHNMAAAVVARGNAG